MVLPVDETAHCAGEWWLDSCVNVLDCKDRIWFLGGWGADSVFVRLLAFGSLIRAPAHWAAAKLSLVGGRIVETGGLTRFASLMAFASPPSRPVCSNRQRLSVGFCQAAKSSCLLRSPTGAF